MAPATTRSAAKNQYEQLKDYTIVVADTGDIEAIKRLQPQDATTNPSLIYKAAQMPQYAHLIDDAVQYSKGDLKVAMVCVICDLCAREVRSATWKLRNECLISRCVVFFLCQDKVAVNFGAEITKIVPGYVSTEVDARLSFDTQATIEKAKSLIKMYDEVGISKDRILIKIAATWEGIKAAEILEREYNITCNLTLVFHLYQAVACAEAGITLISPFVGRIMDWYKKQQGVSGFQPEEDPGVVSVTQIYNYYKKFGYNTIVMGASFRNVEEIQQLAGCDRLTIAPALLDELIAKQDAMEMKLDASASALMKDINKIDITEQTFRWNMNENPMATEKLAEGIRSFAADIVQLEKIIEQKMSK